MTPGIPPTSAATGPGHRPRRQIAYSVGRWRVTYSGKDPASPRTGTLAGRPRYRPAGTIVVPVIADDGPAYAVSWIEQRDILDVSGPAG
ncbi:hypothetical protein [Amycolatopsis sp. NBC_01286]|uniref:hypothetical protein n=1 Tax=Amycolatopsis sp. NBC_01286 TaxID=2903560 RepID=UPI002E12AB39|nr:hypothetical protein OG570_41740 [Amycolatopsis sp. NBC_01286]